MRPFHAPVYDHVIQNKHYHPKVEDYPRIRTLRLLDTQVLPYMKTGATSFTRKQTQGANIHVLKAYVRTLNFQYVSQGNNYPTCMKVLGKDHV